MQSALQGAFYKAQCRSYSVRFHLAPGMTAGEVRQLLNRLLPSAREKLLTLANAQRGTFWANTQLQLRVRKYPKAGGGERVSLVNPQFQSVKLYSHVLKRQVQLQITPEVLRTVESKGGLDTYLLSTPDRQLHSDVASNLKWEVLCKLKEQELRKAQTPGTSAGSS